MRPLHAVALFVVLALLLVGAWLFTSRQDRTEPATRAAVAEHAGVPGHPAPEPDTNLEAPESDRAARDAAVSESVAAEKSPEVQRAGAANATPTFSLTGRVVDHFGKPVVSAIVYADGAAGGIEQPLDMVDPATMPWSRRVEAKTAADGRFAIGPRARSAVRLAVRAPGFAPFDTERPIAGERHDIGDVVLEPSVLLSGRVIDSAGRPVAGAKLLRLVHSGTGFEFFGGLRGALVATTDERGRFQVDQLANGPWKILITSESYPDKVEEGEVERAGASVANLEFVVAEGAEIQGRIVRAPVEALKSLWVRAVPRPANAEADEIETTTSSSGTFAPFGSARRVRVAPDGTFVLRGLARDVPYNLSGRDSEREMSGRRRTQVIAAKAGDRGVELPFQPETALVFQVVDAISGEPITALDVQAGYQWRLPLVDDAGRRVKQFADGRVRFANLPPPPAGERAQVRVESVGYAAFERNDLSVVDGQDFDLGVVRLQRAPIVQVRVLDSSNGAPIAGAQVILSEEQPNDHGHGGMLVSIGTEDEGLIGSGASHRARTDESGVARVTSLPGVRARILVQCPGFAPDASDVIELPRSEDVEREVRLGQGGTVIVEVVDSKGRPVAGVGINREGPSSAFEPIMLGPDSPDVTDALGHVRFEHLEVGVHRFKPREGLGDSFSFGDRDMVVVRRTLGGAEAPEPGWSDVLVAERATETLRIVAPTRSAVTGCIRESGKPLANATVRLVDKDATDPAAMMMLGGGPLARTNGKGEYTLDNVKVGAARISVTHATRSMPFDADVNVREGDNTIDLDLPVAIVEGRVLDAEKHPLSGVRVRAEKARAEGEPRRMVFNAVMITEDGGDDSTVTFSSGDEASAEVRTDADGHYRLRGVLPDVDIVVKASGKDAQPTESKVFKVAPDQVKSDVDFVLEKGGAIEVKVERTDGRPAASCLVRANRDQPQADDPEPKMEVTGPTGVAKLSGLKPGKWRLHVQSLGAQPDTGGEGPADQVVDVAVGQTAAVRFEVP